MGRYIASVGRYGAGTGAFLIPLYGTGEVPQVCCSVPARQPRLRLVLPTTTRCQVASFRVIFCAYGPQAAALASKGLVLV